VADTPPRIVVIGSANIDLVTRVPRIPKPGETLFGHAFTTVTGGKGANQAVAAGLLGARTAFIGRVGNDAFGAMQREALSGAGVDTAFLESAENQPTGTAVILVSDEGQNSIVVTPGANFTLTPADVERAEDIIAGADAVLLQLEIPADTVEAALAIAAKHGVLSVLDPSPAGSVTEAMVRAAGIVSPNETEAEAITGRAVDSVASARAAAECLRGMGAREVVLKLGARGAFYLGDAGEAHVPAFDIEVVDTTAAGDAFTAALAVAWAAMPPAEALRFANAAGAAAASVFGAQPSMPGPDTVRAMMQRGHRED
jgi:ribokinase